LVAEPNRHPGRVGQSYPRKPRPVPILVVETPRDEEHRDTAEIDRYAGSVWIGGLCLSALVTIVVGCLVAKGAVKLAEVLGW
jgi:hypothetical protein